MASFDCNGTPAQVWELIFGPTAVRLNGTDFCLDAGNSKLYSHLNFPPLPIPVLCPAPGNGTPMKIWECFPGIPAQTWFLTTDQRIALNNQGMP